ncbi:hypothetical protein BgiBS90_019150, partial [Biomphalaria glabrata]
SLLNISYYMDRFSKYMLIKINIVIVFIIMYTGSCYAEEIIEGERCTFRAKFKHVLKEDLEVVWLDNDETVSQCSLKGGCMEDFEDETRSTLDFNPETGLASCNVTILKLTRKYVGTWSLSYLGTAGLVHPESLFTCTLSASPTSDGYISFCYSTSNSISDFNRQEDAIPTTDYPIMQEPVSNKNLNLIVCVTVPLGLVALLAGVGLIYVIFGKHDGIEKFKMYWIHVLKASHKGKKSNICIEKPTVLESLIIQKV